MRPLSRRSLRNSDFWKLVQNTTFLRLFLGRVVTDTGDSLYYIGAMWLVWDLTGSAFYTGLAGALLQVPNALSFLVGPLIDRWKLRRILFSTQLINGVGVLIIPIAAVTNQLSVWLVLVLLPILDFVNGFVYPAQNAALPQIVKDEHLTRANSLFSTSIRTVDMIANAIAGGLISLVGVMYLFVVDSVTFAIAAVLFLGVTVPSTEQNDQTNEQPEVEDDSEENGGIGVEYVTELREGINYIRGSSLLTLLLGMMVGNSVLVTLNVVLPAFADTLAGPTAYGLLVAAMGAGSIVGVWGVFLIEEYSLGQIAILTNLFTGLSLLAAVAVPGLWPTIVLFFVAAIPFGAFNVLFGSMYQSAVDDAFLGRVSSLQRTFSSLMMPVGAFIGGIIADLVGSATMISLIGGATILMALYYLSHPGLRSLPSVVEIDEAALGLQTGPETTDEAD